MRGIAVAILAAGACLLAGASASALTISPTGAYRFASGTVTWRWSSHGQALTCTRSAGAFTVAADGTGSAAAGSTVLTSCTNALWGAFTFTQTVAWPVTVQLQASPLAVGLAWTIPSEGLQVSFAGCTYWASGSIVTRASAAALPATITPSTALPVVSSRLVITRNNGGPLCGLFSVGLAMTASATYNVDRTMTISG